MTAAAAEKTLYAFQPWGAISFGSNPGGTLLRDASGALYGATGYGGAYYNGVIFKLTPPNASKPGWTMSVLYTFTGGSDGGSPNPDLVMDASGALYGTARTGGSWMSQGLVFKLAPPANPSSAWTQTVLHRFYYNRWDPNANDGSNPGPVIMDADGTLYGSTQLGGSTTGTSITGYGTVFKLTPPGVGQTQWTETVLYRFNGGADGESPMFTMALDAAGNLYGSTMYGGGGRCAQGCGTIFKLIRPGAGQTTWTKTTLYQFTGGSDGGTPQGKLLPGSGGVLYGAAYKGGTGGCTDLLYNAVIGCGVIFKLTPPQSGGANWVQSVLYNFSGPDGAFPQGGVIAGGNGTLLGTVSSGSLNSYGVGGYGFVFRLAPPAAGQPVWTRTVLHEFNISTSGSLPIGELVRAPDNRLFGVTFQGGPHYGGTVYEITP